MNNFAIKIENLKVKVKFFTLKEQKVQEEISLIEKTNSTIDELKVICGAVYLVLTLIFAVVFYDNFNGLIAVVLSIGIGIVPVILIGVFISEIHLRSIFDSDGNRK
ncbi:hypothetical protein [Clostridium kluyveri]|uniref:hypothetical protein n=1 Tax=Clostridium kluyveri TaxID=1534 RepID=UPI0022464EA1|nr:hypothetical protein [Clostridium kluyveri]UZQ50019.1 hypothetical protein OP486_19045 [Clostridium kluyveri]